MTQTLVTLFERDLDALTREISAFYNEENLWLTPGDVNNSAGNLCLHLTGNLQHFIGAVLGNSGYVRNRENEFIHRCSRQELLDEITAAKSIVLQTLKQLPAEGLENNYPIEVFGHPMTTSFFLTHLHGHLTYHLGQISYHRRILDIQ